MTGYSICDAAIDGDEGHPLQTIEVLPTLENWPNHTWPRFVLAVKIDPDRAGVWVRWEHFALRLSDLKAKLPRPKPEKDLWRLPFLGGNFPVQYCEKLVQ